MEKNSKYSRRRRNPEIHRLTSEQIKQLLGAAQDHPFKALLSVAITTGLRRQELLNLHWEDIDLQSEIVHVRRMDSSIGGKGSTDTARTIALPTIATQALKEHWHVQEKAQVETGERWHHLNLVFPNEVGQPFNPRKFRQHYHDLFVTVGLPQMHFHDLRRGTAIFFLEIGVSIAVIKSILGFRYQSTSIHTLTPITLSMQKEAMRQWDMLLSGIHDQSSSHTIRYILPHTSEVEEE